MALLPSPDAATDALVERALARLLERAPQALASPKRREALARLALCSDFAVDTLCRQPALLASLDAAAGDAPDLPPGAEPDW
ncbi:hypothetical protein, partial [Arenimonas malthae]|uniref:hypothetical protein n=1 Tax=Arenimonas malthae TaxID=354197 RepID=UPI0005C1CC55